MALPWRGPPPADDEVHFDSYRERLMKYVPAEALVLFVAVYGSAYAVLGTEPFFPLLARWIVLAGIAVTVIWLWKIDGVTDLVQVGISAVGFVAWIFAFGVVPVAELPWYNQVAAALFLPVYVFVSPVLDGIPDRF
ncbi:MAG: hypothetical protein GYA23_11605 [Methanomicrobiales archaeon]|nr:hypothetical protein [Methanomicrobiales archaeon]